MVITKVRRAAKVVAEDSAEEEAVEAAEEAGDEAEEAQETQYDDPWEPLVEPQPPAPPPLPHAELVPGDDRRLPATPRELLGALPPLPRLRAEIIEGKLIVSPAGTTKHGRRIAALFRVMDPIAAEKDWEAFPGHCGVCIEGPRDSVEPDFVIAPVDCPQWGDSELVSSWLIMVAEVVSPGSIRVDREQKLRLFALGRVPMYLLIDPEDTQPSVTVFSGLKDDAYSVISKVPFGTPIRLPEPIGIELDTSIFK
ncbi:Uma2 family endonuclease [Spongiactinospora rosea]|uniref:Uma2 family endonuclease n=1 Tax=Spongiactinospora rosea TaxID=2248750 RepID=A0A366M2P5_9ACTN|nr:Uma2 family endonuclease [Spongiactinospora rosea]RBQ19702.1 Uma2 family endonuclease [Spongiactinospora rosea]